MEIYLQPMTHEQMQAFYKEFEYDADTFDGSTQPQKYVYEKGRVDAIYEKHKAAGKLHFAIMRSDEVIGDVYFKHFDYATTCCELSIHLKNDSVKNRGYGTKAEILALEYAFQVLGIKTVYADALIKNTRSCHVLKKAGFKQTHTDEQYCYFRCDKESWSRK